MIAMYALKKKYSYSKHSQSICHEIRPYILEILFSYIGCLEAENYSSIVLFFVAFDLWVALIFIMS